jgi:ribosomal protein S18 acetylase RimI-like enzyme
VTSLEFSTPNEIRRLEVPADLSPVADLIDICFSGTMDEDGLDYLRHIRRAASNPALVRWLPAAGELVSFPLYGFVWMEQGVIVGNLSLIPFYWQHHWRFLVANVAVHPDYRRRGIGKELTKKAIQHARSLGHRDVWLHVREGNLPAIELYRSLGFIERSLRTSWQNNKPEKNGGKLSNIEVSSRKTTDWEEQRKFLQNAYPEEVAWNLNFRPDRFRPGLVSFLSNMVNNREMRHWVARSGQQLLGTAIWEPSNQFADTIWLGLSAAGQEKVIEALLVAIKNDLGSRRPLLVNFPANEGAAAFMRSGFQLVHNLLWMEKIL